MTSWREVLFDVKDILDLIMNRRMDILHHPIRILVKIRLTKYMYEITIN
ncbi:MAG: hypothetical protein K0R00_3409 [Herbinix sp.]|jgi:hypothetical protein|nr:hypothetical protein [Herbinix sp.]